MADYLKPEKPSPDMDAGRSAQKVSDAMKKGGQDSACGSMGKNQMTGDMLEAGTHPGGKGKK